jgi:hypothetical protein
MFATFANLGLAVIAAALIVGAVIAFVYNTYHKK